MLYIYCPRYYYIDIDELKETGTMAFLDIRDHNRIYIADVGYPGIWNEYNSILGEDYVFRLSIKILIHEEIHKTLLFESEEACRDYDNISNKYEELP